MISSYRINCCNNPESSIVVTKIDNLQSGDEEKVEEDNDDELIDEKSETNEIVETNDILDILNYIIDDVLSIVDYRENRRTIKIIIDSLVEKIELEQLNINLSFLAIKLKKTNSLNSIASDFFNVSSITSITAISTNADSTPFKISNKVTQSFDSTESVLGDMDDYIMDDFDEFVDCNDFDENNEKKIWTMK